MTDPAVLNPVPAPPPAAPAGPLAELILVRLLTEKKSLGEKKLRTDLEPFFRRPPPVEEFADTLAGLRAAGLLTPKGQRLTDAGRQQALAYLGVADLPVRTNWRTVKARYLVPKALGLSPTSAEDAKLFGKAEKLAPLLLKRKLGLPVGTGLTLKAAFEAIACRELGFRDQTKLEELIPTLLGRAIGSPEPIGKRDAERVAPQVLLGAARGGIEGLRGVVLAGWADGAAARADRPAAPGPAEAFDLEAFANTVKAAARTSPTGRFGDNKVFISHVWRQLATEPPFARLGPDGFKRRLVEANARGLLALSRADLVQVMDPDDVRESETGHLNALFHFVVVEKE